VWCELTGSGRNLGVDAMEKYFQDSPKVFRTAAVTPYEGTGRIVS
jgi:tRNA(Met) C34 N-acetyltransferase TmcA